MKKLYLFIIFSLSLALSGCGKNGNTDYKPEVNQIRTICNLATLECYYHNVAKSVKTSDSWFKVDRKFWIEYTGIAKIGIDMTKVNMEIDEDNVTVTMPDAELLSIDILESDLNEDSYIMSGDSIISNKITAEDQSAAIDSAQNQMAANVKANKSLLLSAQKRAEELIQNYINRMGEISGVDYKVNWVYLPEEDDEESIDEDNSDVENEESAEVEDSEE